MTTSVVRQCERRLTALGIEDIPDLDDLCHQIGALQGRRIRLVPVALPADRLCGLVVGADQWAAVYYHHDPDQPAGTLTSHQRHIVHHELAHLVWGHTSATGIGADVARILAPSIDPAYVQRILGRTTYTTDVEVVAEVTASIWTARAAQRNLLKKITVDSANVPPGLAGVQLRREKLDPLWWFVVQTTPEVLLNQWFAVWWRSTTAGWRWSPISPHRWPPRLGKRRRASSSTSMRSLRRPS
jgi:hypothetical protein